MASSESEEDFEGFANESLSTQRISTSLLDEALAESSVDLFEQTEEEHPLAPRVPFEPGMAPKLSDAEQKARSSLDTNLAQLKRFKDAEINEKKHKARERCLEKCWSFLKTAETLAQDRLNTLEGQEKNVALEEWFKYLEANEEEIQEQQIAHDKFESDAAPPAAGDVASEAQVVAKKSMLLSKKNQVENGLVALRRELENIPDSQNLNKPQYHHYSLLLDSLRVVLYEDMDAYQQELLGLKPADAQTLSTTYSGYVDPLYKDFQEVTLVLASKNIPDDVVFTSTPQNSILEPAGGAVGGQGVSKKSLYHYSKEKIPGFESGDVGEYPGFKKEWEESVMPGQSDAWVIRNLQRLTPKEDDLSIFCTAKEAWAHLDAKYANPVAVSSTLMKDFLAVTKLDGSNDQQRVLDLYLKVMKLHKRLTAVEEAEQLTNNMTAISHVLRLLPPKYNDEWAAMRESQKDGDDPNQSRRAKADELWKTLKDFLTKKKYAIEEYCPWTLDKAKPSQQSSTSGKKVNQVNKKPASTPSSSAATSGQNNKLSSDEKIKKKQLEYGKCPACSGYHTWKAVRGPVASKRLADCPTYRQMAIEDKVNFLVEKKCCIRCLDWTHTRDDCSIEPSKFKCTFKDSNDSPCGKDHHRMIHSSSNPAINLFSLSINSTMIDSNPVLMMVVTVPISNTVSTVVLMDGGSNCSLITHALAEKLGLVGRFTTELVELAGEEPEWRETKYYILKLPLPDGGSRKMKLLGLERITSNDEPADVTPAYSLFPKAAAGSLDRPRGDVGILLGLDQNDLLPTGGSGENMVGRLRLMNTPWGDIICGHHPKIKAPPNYIHIRCYTLW